MSQDTATPVATTRVTVPNVGAQIQARMGILPQSVRHSNVAFVVFQIDDSNSINWANNAQLVRDAYNAAINKLKAKREKNNILVYCSYLNKGLLYDYRFLDDVPLLDSQNYRPRGGTPLYDRTGQTLRDLKAKADEFKLTGIDVRTVTVIITDGEDYGSHRETPATITRRIRVMRSGEENLILGIGIDNQRTDFRAVFASMGIPPECVKTPADADEFLEAMDMVSQISLAAAQGINLGGFTS